MLVTGQLPSVAGIEIAPCVEVGTARAPFHEPLPTDALPSKTVYVHSIPSTTAVLAKEVRGRRRRRAREGRRGLFIENASSASFVVVFILRV